MTGTRTLARTEVLCRDSNSASLGQRFVCILVFQNECAPAHPQRIARQSTCFRTFLGHATGAEHASSVPKMISTTATGTVLFMAARQMPTRNGNSSCHPPKFLSGVRRRRAAVDHVTRRLIDHHQSHKSGEVRRNVFSNCRNRDVPSSRRNWGPHASPFAKIDFIFTDRTANHLILYLLVLSIGLCLTPIGSASLLLQKRASYWNSQMANSRAPYCHNLRRRTALALLASKPLSKTWPHSALAKQPLLASSRRPQPTLPMKELAH